MSFESYYAQYEQQLVDVWGRRLNDRAVSRTIGVFGRTVRLSSNEELVLEAAEFSQPLFSSAPLANREPFEIHFVVRPFPNPPGPLPDNLFDRIQYSGYGGWLALNLGNWGHCHIDLDKGRAWAVLGPELGFRPEAVSRYLLNTILTNFMIAEG
jgi:hypothetical protein